MSNISIFISSISTLKSVDCREVQRYKVCVEKELKQKKKNGRDGNR